MGCGFSNPQVDPQANASVASQAADPIGQGLQDAQEAVGLFDGIYKLVGPAVLDAVNKKNRTWKRRTGCSHLEVAAQPTRHGDTFYMLWQSILRMVYWPGSQPSELPGTCAVMRLQWKFEGEHFAI